MVIQDPVIIQKVQWDELPEVRDLMLGDPSWTGAEEEVTGNSRFLLGGQ